MMIRLDTSTDLPSIHSMPSKKLSISIVHHHGCEMLRDCLNSIFANAPNFQFEVVVVDNLSNDGSIAMIESEFPQVRLIKNKERHGFGQNQNIGISYCSSEYVFVYNDDTLLQKNALENLCESLDENPDVGIVGPKLLNADGSLQISCYRFPTPVRLIWDNFLLSAAFPRSTMFGDYRQWDYSEVRVVDSVKGAAMMVRKSVIDLVGGFDEQFFMYFEEIDWQMRMKRAGFKTLFLPGASVIHLGGGSSIEAEERHFSEYQTSSIKFTRKHYGLAGVAIQGASILIGSIISMVMWSLIRCFASSKRELASRQIKRSKRIFLWWIGASPHDGLSTNCER